MEVNGQGDLNPDLLVPTTFSSHAARINYTVSVAVNTSVLLRPLVLKGHRHHLEDRLNHRPLGPTPTASDSGGLGWGLTLCISNKFQGMSMLLVGDHTLMIYCPRVYGKRQSCLGLRLMIGPHPPLSTLLLPPPSRGRISPSGLCLKSLSLRTCGGIRDPSLLGQITLFSRELPVPRHEPCGVPRSPSLLRRQTREWRQGTWDFSASWVAFPDALAERVTRGSASQLLFTWHITTAPQVFPGLYLGPGVTGELG